MTDSKPPLKKKRKKKRKVTKVLGRPTVFNEAIHKKIVELAEGGATEDEIAEFIGVHPNTIYLWKRKHRDLMWALKDAKGIADELVEASLFRRACGYSHKAVKHFPDKHKVMNMETGEMELRTTIIEHEYVEHYPPSEVAAIFWLKNRQPERWRDKPEPPKPEDTGQTTIVYESEWGGTGEPTTPHMPSDGDGEAI